MLNPDKKIVNIIRKSLEKTGGYCPCISSLLWGKDTKCPCKYYRETKICRCKLYI